MSKGTHKHTDDNKDDPKWLEKIIREDVQIQHEIEFLRNLRHSIIKTDEHGHDNHAAIDAQIVTLEERLHPENAMMRFLAANDFVSSAARDAADWLVGILDDPLSIYWEFEGMIVEKRDMPLLPNSASER